MKLFLSLALIFLIGEVLCKPHDHKRHHKKHNVHHKTHKGHRRQDISAGDSPSGPDAPPPEDETQDIEPPFGDESQSEESPPDSPDEPPPDSPDDLDGPAPPEGPDDLGHDGPDPSNGPDSPDGPDSSDDHDGPTPDDDVPPKEAQDHNAAPPDDGPEPNPAGLADPDHHTTDGISGVLLSPPANPSPAGSAKATTNANTRTKN